MAIGISETTFQVIVVSDYGKGKSNLQSILTCKIESPWRNNKKSYDEIICRVIFIFIFLLKHIYTG